MYDSIGLNFSDGLWSEKTPPVVVIFAFAQVNLDAVSLKWNWAFFRLHWTLSLWNSELEVGAFKVTDFKNETSFFKVTCNQFLRMALDILKFKKDLNPFGAWFIVRVFCQWHEFIVSLQPNWGLRHSLRSNFHWFYMLLWVNTYLDVTVNVIAINKMRVNTSF